MDLTTLYNLTTTELRAEAERLGVADTYALSRAQLIHAIRSRAGSPQPEGLFGRVIGFAKWALQSSAAPDPQPEPDRRVEREQPRADRGPAPAAQTSRSPGPRRAPDPTEEPLAVEVPSGAKAALEAEVESAPPSPSAASRAIPTRSTPSASGEDTDAKGSTTPPARAPAGVFSGATTTFEEPFPTRTMARILAAQGHYKRSLAIYASLLRNSPEDADLEHEASEVRTRSRARRTQAP